MNYTILQLPLLPNVTGNEYFAVNDGTTYKVQGITLKSYFASGGGAAVWGGITGTLSAQTDLQTALNLKANTASLGTVAALSYPGNTTTFLRGDGTFATPAGSGDVVGPASSVTARIATFNGTTGKLIQDGGTTIAQLATLASPALTGTPTAPTATAGTTTTQVATTAFARTPAVQSVTSSATVTPTFSNDMVEITAQAAALNLANPTGTAIPALGIVVRVKDNGTARAITYGTQYRAVGVTLPTTTVLSKTLYLGMIYNSADTKWDVTAVAQEA